MKNFVILFILLFGHMHAFGQELYYKSYDEPGFIWTIKEIERGSNFSLLEISITDSDAQGAFAIIAAAIEIGESLGKSHFMLAQEYKVEDLYYNKIFFPSGPTVDPKDAFLETLDDKIYKRFKDIGYFEIENYKRIFNLKGKN